MKKNFSKDWKSSKKPRKQRKYQKNAPLHTKSKFLSSHLSEDLKKKYNTRCFSLRKGDKVKILRGNFRGKAGKIDRIDLKNTEVYVAGIEVIKKDGTKTFRSIHP